MTFPQYRVQELPASPLGKAQRVRDPERKRQLVLEHMASVLKHLGPDTSRERLNQHLLEDGCQCSAEDFPRCYQQAFGVVLAGQQAQVVPTKTSEVTLEWLICQAARELPQPFTLAQLVVACWRKAPQRFALAGFPEYPDTQRVLPALCGKRGLVARGLLRKVAPKMYQVNKLFTV